VGAGSDAIDALADFTRKASVIKSTPANATTTPAATALKLVDPFFITIPPPVFLHLKKLVSFLPK
jgi:hypothetical protein